MQQAIHALKYQRTPQLAPSLARYLCAGYTQYFLSSNTASLLATSPSMSAILPVPLHPRRLAQRGYNQSVLLARDLAAFALLPLYENVLERMRDTPPQVGLNFVERHTNVADAFRVTSDLTGLSILLIDDVYTTGATLRACASAARAAGASEVRALTLARPLLGEL